MNDYISFTFAKMFCLELLKEFFIINRYKYYYLFVFFQKVSSNSDHRGLTSDLNPAPKSLFKVSIGVFGVYLVVECVPSPK